MRQLTALAITIGLISGCNDSGPDNQAPEFTSAAVTVTASENSTGTDYIANASDAEAGALSYQLSGDDAALFGLDASNSLSFLAPQDFESPSDANSDNVFLLTVTVTDNGGLTASQELSIALGDIDEAPVPISPQTASLAEGDLRSPYQAEANDPENQTLSYSISGGADAAFFTIDPDGALTPINALDFELPSDQNSDNTYAILLSASDGSNSVEWPLNISVADVAPAFGELTVDVGSEPKEIVFDWELIEAPSNISTIELFENKDGNSGFVSVASVPANDIPSYRFEVSLLDTNFSSARYLLEAQDENTNVLFSSNEITLLGNMESSDVVGYFKASNADTNDQFGYATTISNDGTTIAVAAPFEDSAATEIDGEQADENAPNAGAVYVFDRSGGLWIQRAYLKTGYSDQDDWFGRSLDMNDDGTVLIVGSPGEDSSSLGVDQDEANNDSTNAGAAYIFRFSGGVWEQEAYLKPDGTVPTLQFGSAVAISGSGTVAAVGGGEEDNGKGAVYTFRHGGVVAVSDGNEDNTKGAVNSSRQRLSQWTPDTRILAGTVENFSAFGETLALNTNGTTLVAASPGRDAGGVFNTGAVHVFNFSNSLWTEETMLLAPNPGVRDAFGTTLDIDAAGNVLVVGSNTEDSAPGADLANPSESLNDDYGAAYVFRRNGQGWSYEQLLKPHVLDAQDLLSYSLSMSGDGTTIALGAPNEASSETGTYAMDIDSTAVSSGAVFLYRFDGSSWLESQMIKGPTSEIGDGFGVAVSLSFDGLKVVVGALGEDSSSTGIQAGGRDNNTRIESGAAYLY
ncbi:MAG: hypothetical protein AAF385_05045 [Pseudomonadota bacterium]